MTATKLVNFWVGYNDAIAERSETTIESSTGADSGYPATNLLDDSVYTCWRYTGSGTVYVEFDLGTSLEIAGCALVNHNAGDLAQTYSELRVNYGNSSPPTGLAIANSIRSSIGNDDFVRVFQTPLAGRYWQFKFTFLNSGTLSVGRMVLFRDAFGIDDGVGLGSRLRYEHNEQVASAVAGGEFRFDVGRLRPVLDLNLNLMPVEKWEQLEDMVRAVKVNHSQVVTTVPFGTTKVGPGQVFGLAVLGYLDEQAIEIVPVVGGYANAHVIVRGVG